MIVALRKPALRIALALVLSIILHGFVMWAPDVRLPHKEVVLPPLTARLEPLMQPAAAPEPIPKPAAKPKPATKPGLAHPPEPRFELASQAQSAVAPAATLAEQAAVAEHEPESVTDVKTIPAAVAAEEPVSQHPLPKHAQLDFAVYKGSSSFMIGEVHHTLEIVDGRYTLKAVTKTTGLAGLLKSYLLTQASRGMAGNKGLQPEIFEEEKISSGSTQKLDAMFDWTAHTVHFSHGAETDLPADAQDILSMLYQLSQLSMHREIVPLTISNGKKLEKYELEIGPQEEIVTPLGKLRALHLRKLHPQGEEGLEIWLGLEYRMLPVKFRHIDRSGEVAGEALITGIRVADE